jgi:hypothetical protein
MNEEEANWLLKEVELVGFTGVHTVHGGVYWCPYVHGGVYWCPYCPWSFS